MKKIAFILVSLICLSSFSQETDKTEIERSENFNEVKLNGLMAVVGALEIGYERTINDESAFGVSVLVPYDGLDTSLNYYVSPYYRIYFGKKYAAGFFVEGFGMLSSEDTSTIILGNNPTITRDPVLDFALGIGFGGKWVSKKGLIAELNLAFGRNLFNTEDTSTEAVGKIGITIGYRF